MIRIRSSFLLGLNKLAATKSNNSYSAPPLFGLSSTQIKPDHLSTSCRKCHYIHHVVRVDSHVNVTKAAHQSIMETMRHTSLFLLPPNLEQEHETISATSSPIPHPVSASAPSSLNYALVLLNQRIPQFTPQLWDHARLRLCADGGANRLYDDMPLLFPQEDPWDVRCRYKPDVIEGDMDSIRKEVEDFYLNMGTTIKNESDDQDTTDLQKCLSYICDSSSNHDKLCILVAGAVGGRFDHEMGNINVLYRYSDLRMILLSDDCLIHLLPKNKRHEIHILSSVEGPHCGLIPIGSSSTTTTTTGLRWNLNDTKMEFGGLISTSNLVHDDIITVCSDSDLLWTISIKKKE
ncbi:Thiamine diphosphokinase [Zostera marina]|uniref:thiamine diphosphokinase n=1 Tax=Zostera marina TaxID=29655 RepID=A0A0K9NVR5_ZOSMR|nr:Thiamine diphosphokinase [Zostera marina]